MNYVGIGLLVVLVLAALRAFCVRYKSERDRAAADEEKRNSMLIQQQQSLLEEKISSANTNTDPEQLSATTPQLNKLDSNNAQETRESKLQRLRELVAAEQAESDRLERELAEVEADLEQDRKRAAQRNKGLRGLLSEKKARRYSQQQKLPQQTQHKKQQKDHRSGDVPTAHRGLAMNPQYSHDESSDSFSESSESGEGSDGSSTCSTSCSSTCSVSDVDMEFGSGTDDE